MTTKIGYPSYIIEPEQHRALHTVALAVGGFLTAAFMVLAVAMWWLIAAAEYAR